MKKTTQASLLTALLCSAVTSCILADDPAPTSSGQQRTQMIGQLSTIQQDLTNLPGGITSGISSGIASGFASLEAYLDKKYHETMLWIFKENYKTVPQIQAVITANTAQITPQNGTPLSPTQAAVAKAQSETEANLHNSLTQFMFSIYGADPTVTKTITTAEGQPYATYLQNNSTASLSVSNPQQASDALYISKKDIISQGKSVYISPYNQPWLIAPAKTTNDFINFSTVISPTSYTPDQATAANLFLKYAGQSTLNLTEGIPLSKLYQNPAALLSLKQNPTYQKYVVTMRTFVAIRSMNLNTLNQLIAERTPIKGLGTTAGLSTPDASPLQVEAHQANWRVESPTWYTALGNTAPSALQRETLVLLAEIEHQNYQAHLDRERILAAVTAMNLQSSAQMSKIFLTQENNKIADLIGSSVKQTAKPIAAVQPPTS